MYDGALANAGLSTDPFTGGQYAFGDGNPVSNMEYDGHNILGSLIGDAESGLQSLVSDGESLLKGAGGALKDLGGAVEPAGGGFLGTIAEFATKLSGYGTAAWVFLNTLGVNTGAGNAGTYSKPGKRPDYSKGLLITQQDKQEWDPGYSGSTTPNDRQDDQNCSAGSSWVYYMPRDTLNRAQGAMACLTAGGFNYKFKGGLRYSNDSQIVGSDASVNPTGWRPGMDRGHLLGRQLGGAGNDARNLVPLWPGSNQQLMRRDENLVDCRCLFLP